MRNYSISILQGSLWEGHSLSSPLALLAGVGQAISSWAFGSLHAAHCPALVTTQAAPPSQGPSSHDGMSNPLLLGFWEQFKNNCFITALIASWTPLFSAHPPGFAHRGHSTQSPC